MTLSLLFPSEVDEDDRDFRRSRRHESEATGGEGGVGGARRIVAPIQVNYGGSTGRGGLIGKKRTVNSLQEGPPST